MTTFDQSSLLPQREVQRRMGGVSSMTIHRWRLQGTLPTPVVINKRNYWRAADITRIIDDAEAGNSRS
jgi:predicted site-specific integrase-resolvase